MDIKIAIIEDDDSSKKMLEKMIKMHPLGQKHSFLIHTFSTANAFLSTLYTNYNVIFLDIQMPGINGMEAAKEIRKKDENVLLVFVTNLAQYAVDGYEVKAYDFILKPVAFASFSMKFDRICNQLEHNFDESYITITTRSTAKKIHIIDIIYIEVINHDLIFHTIDGEYRMRETMNNVEIKLLSHHFSRCNSCYLLNLKYVKEFYGDVVVIGEKELKMSQTRKQSFLCDLAKYMGSSV